VNDTQEEGKTKQKQNKTKPSQFVIDEEKKNCYPIRERERDCEGAFHNSNLRPDNHPFSESKCHAH
jgi:hypothetical protein